MEPTILDLRGPVGWAVAGDEPKGQIKTATLQDGNRLVITMVVEGTYDAETDSWLAYVYRGGRHHTIGTYSSEARAKAAYEAAMMVENPALHTAPARVERTGDPLPHGD